MDVSGRDPSAPAGKYFRANIWSWGPIHALITELCSDLFDEETLRGLACNDGAGLDDQATCTEMANRFEHWMEHHAQGHAVDRGLPQADAILRILAESGLSEKVVSPAPPDEPRHRVADEHLKEWIEFLRHCGGFEVW
jgi:hypothetical protein